MGVDLMRILPATGLFNAFAALQNLNREYQRGIDREPFETPDELDEHNLMEEYLTDNDDMQDGFLAYQSPNLLEFFPANIEVGRTLLKIRPGQMKKTVLPGLRLGKRSGMTTATFNFLYRINWTQKYSNFWSNREFVDRIQTIIGLNRR
eukprot:TRINITY_DN37931_c0_g1_i1.p1 TRINITY_DN37931_c0_g1~~TRINITY_DN37931_c0_g1_i1.p1  ORF type:complete len:157 (-),score=37.02 TRINITY_DN37931_c0_g1_i1:110-556(-)